MLKTFGVKEKIVVHPITYISGLFRDSELNWSALAKEAYAIYMPVRKLSFYLEVAFIILRSYHLPSKILEKNTLNSKVNEWAEEIEHYEVKLECFKAIKSTSVGTMSRLIKFDPNLSQKQEPEGQEYGYYVIDQLHSVSIVPKVPQDSNLQVNEIDVST